MVGVDRRERLVVGEASEKSSKNLDLVAQVHVWGHFGVSGMEDGKRS